MLRILFIDDQPESVRDAKERLEETYNTVELQCSIADFIHGEDEIASWNPDIVILDIWTGKPQTSDAEGYRVLDFVWDHRFCPVIIYSADSHVREDLLIYQHPFVIPIQKGRGSDMQVLEGVKTLAPHVTALNTARDNIRNAFSQVMRHVAPEAFQTTEDETERRELVVRAGRRRLAALMDAPLPDGTQLVCWEQYIWPPVSESPLMGDILRLKAAGDLDPQSYRVILTPSCDMVTHGGRTPKVKEVLVAKCYSMDDGLTRLGISIGSGEKDLSDNPLLSQGYSGAIVAVPSLSGKIPTMVADLRSLDLIAISNIADEVEYERVASIDSPFREALSWAYLQISSRPGLPDRNLSALSKEINAAVRRSREV